jgi:hypothetical protein
MRGEAGRKRARAAAAAAGSDDDVVCLGDAPPAPAPLAPADVAAARGAALREWLGGAPPLCDAAVEALATDAVAALTAGAAVGGAAAAEGAAVFLRALVRAAPGAEWAPARVRITEAVQAAVRAAWGYVLVDACL